MRRSSRPGAPMPLAALAVLSASCVLGPEAVLPRNVTAGEFCASQSLPDSPRPPMASRTRGDRGEDESVDTKVALERGYSPRTLDTARAIGALGFVESLAEARTQGAAEAEIVVLRGKIFDAIAIATLDLASTVAHVECEEGRASEIAANLRDAEDVQTRRLTAFSLVVTAAGAVASGALDLIDKNTTASSLVGIGGGIAGGALGFATLAVHRTADFRHARNILAEVWYGDAHPDFPEVVWAHLTRPQSGVIHARTIREGLVAKWKASEHFGEKPSSDRTALFFGAGGTYDADSLEERANMLIEVRDVVDLMSHDLQQLATDISYR
jgi:hypothetical protein